MGELDAYASLLRRPLERLAAIVETLPSDALDRAPVEGASSPAQLAAHVVGAARAYALGLGCGADVDRDRRAEFATARMGGAALAAALRDLAGEAEATFADTDPAILDETVLPPQHLFGQGPSHEIGRREAIVSAIAHASEHLGELQLTRDLAAQA